jgi:hypothetical protein
MPRWHWDRSISDFWGAPQKDCLFEILSDARKSYVQATINQPRNTLKKHPKYGFCRRRYRPPVTVLPGSGMRKRRSKVQRWLPHLFAGQNRTLAAAATGKHRQNASTICRVLTWLINNKKITSSRFDIDLLHIMLIDCCVRRRRGRGTMAAVGRRRPPWSGCVLFH